MMKSSQTRPTCVFLDIGGVILTDGWQHQSRKLAAKKFKLDWKEMEIRHHLNFETHELGKLSMDDYLERTVFYMKRSFSKSQFKEFMFAQSQPYPKMLELIRKLKSKYGLKIIVVSNEGGDLNAYRIHHFKLSDFVDSFISSCYVHLNKPDQDIFQLALDTAQVPAEKIIYIENTALFVEVAKKMGIKGIVHTDYESTRKKLATLGLNDSEGGKHGAH